VRIPRQVRLRQECHRIVYSSHLGSFVHSLHFLRLGALDNGFPYLPGAGLIRVSEGDREACPFEGAGAAADPYRKDPLSLSLETSLL